MPWAQFKAAAAPYLVLIRVGLLLGLVGFAYWKGHQHADDANAADALREAAVAQAAAQAFADAWDAREAEIAASQAADAQSAEINSQELAREVARHIRLRPFDVACRWPDGLRRAYSDAVDQANAAAAGVPAPAGAVPRPPQRP